MRIATDLSDVRPGDNISAARFNAILAAVRSLLLRVEQGQNVPPLDLVELSEDLTSGQIDKTADLRSFDTTASPGSDHFASSGQTLQYVIEPFGGLFLQGERHATFFSESAGQRFPIPGVLFHFGKTDAAIAAGVSGTVSVWKHNSGTTADTGLNVTAWNKTGAALPSGAEVFMLFHNEGKAWYILPRGTGAQNRWLKVNAAITDGGSGCHHVTGYICDCDGSNADTGTEITVYFENASWRYPNVKADNVIPIAYNDAKSVWMCDVQDDFLGAIKLIDCGVTIPQGWEVYSAAKDRFVMGTDTGSTGTGLCGSTGGSATATIFSATGGPGGGPYYVYADTCQDVLDVVGGVSVADCAAKFVLPETTFSTLPPYVKLRYIKRVLP